MSEKLKGMHISEVVLQEIPVMFMVAEGGPAGAQAAFHRLEEAVGTRGRKFYGTLLGGTYHANVALRDIDNPDVYVFETGQIPGGKYAKTRIEDYDEQKLGEILERKFWELADIYKGKIDPSRPSIEFYRRENELLLMLPII